MSIVYQIPSQARYLPTSTVFAAVFNAVTPARYDFGGTAANQDVNVLLLQPGTVYLIEKVSVGGNITEGQFLESMDIFPAVTIKRSISKATVYQQALPIVNYFDGLEASAWVISDKSDDYLTLSFSGSLAQLPSMVGIGTARIQVSLQIFGIESAYYNAAFRDQLASSIGQRNRR